MNMNISSLRNNKLFSALSCCPQYFFSTTNCNRLFFEKDPKGGYNKSESKYPQWKHLRDGWKQLGKEVDLFKKELKESLVNDPITVLTPGVVKKEWELRNGEHLENWMTTSDSDHGEGHSSCSLILNNNGFGHFSGILDTTVPQDGKTKRAGYCSIRSKRARKSFQRESFYNWCTYTHLVLRVRGDGRSYLLSIATSGYFDQLWNDVYQYVLYTRGGPYWQTTKIPFSKFFFSNKGRIQDIQSPIELDRVTHFGITAGDKINGPFSLEIDYIGVIYDPSHKEEFAYEMYQLPQNIAAS
ncbi:complex I intermediate-associated protein 30, mitochondrial [Halyomorpha halys]|uniref:complex I intermediate-associated protein 30, mitochondrial n=1 Tax=Halyomorpha halys TaxID=286706 RepID=UPI0034D2EA4D